MTLQHSYFSLTVCKFQPYVDKDRQQYAEIDGCTWSAAANSRPTPYSARSGICQLACSKAPGIAVTAAVPDWKDSSAASANRDVVDQ